MSLKKTLAYQGYTTILQQDPGSQVWHGRVLGIEDVVSFEGRTQVEAEKKFHDSVDLYLTFCQTLKRPPSTPSEQH